MKKTKQGMVLFVVLGGIFVLTILILSYNHLVQGKFNESREIIRHLRAMKVAQSVSRYLIARMKNDLSSSDNSPGSTGLVLRQAFRNSSANALGDAVNDDWLFKVINEDSFNDLKQKLFVTQTLRDVSISSHFTFSDITPLETLKQGDELFLDFEKAGFMTLTVDVFIGRSRETWTETRPFRVVMPYPLPLTKFSLYLRSAADPADEMKFNTVNIETPDTGKTVSGSAKPLIFFHGKSGDQNNARENIWEERGWVYLGGGRISLNRAGGHDGFGQGFHSYFAEAKKPITLDFNYKDRTGQDFTGVQVGSKNLIFTVARWGFAKTLYDGTFSNVWKEVLKGEFAAREQPSHPKWWNSSCLHLFGSSRLSGSERMISMTRVIGDVRDRFLEMCYLADSFSRKPVGAVITHGPSSYNDIINSNSGVSDSFTSNLFVDQGLIYLSVQPNSEFGVNDLREMEPFFINLRYSEPGEVIAYRKIMSRIDNHAYDETYDLIAQYCANYQRIDIPPRAIVPLVGDTDFKLEVMGLNTRKLKIDKIAAGDDATLGMAKRVCYEIEATQDENAFDILKNNFCMTGNSDFNLANTVVRVKTNGRPFAFGDNLGTNTGGSILVDGDISLGTFRKSDEPDRAPVLIMAEKGSIKVTNSTNPTLAYLVALDKNAGRIKFADPQSQMKLLGGIAAHNIDPDEIKGGGVVFYNSRLDPTQQEFSQFIGVAVGPAGGEK